MNTQTQNHEAFQDDLKAFLDGELSPERSQLVARHLENCKACRKERDIMDLLRQEIADETAALPLTDKLKARILGAAPAAPQSPAAPDRASLSIGRLFDLRRHARDLSLLGVGFAVVAFLAVNTTLNKKVQTVFNVANNALSTGGGDDEPASDTSAADAPAPDNSPASNEKAASDAEESQSLAKRSTVALRNREADKQNEMQSGSAAAAQPTPTRKMHKDADLEIEVARIEPASNKVVSLVNGYGGYIASNNLDTGQDGARTATIEARVPVGNFDKAVASIGDQGTVKKKTVTGQDITMRYSDAQQETGVVSSELHVSEAQLRAALKRAEKRGRPGDVPWELRDEVRKLRVETAQAAARLGIARQLSNLSNITVQLNEKAHVPGSGGFADSISETGREAGVTFSQAARIPIACIIWVLAYSPLWLPLLLLGLFLHRKLQVQR